MRRSAATLRQSCRVPSREMCHLPVTEGDRQVGMVSIGNLVNWVISEQQETIHQLESYISGNPG